MKTVGDLRKFISEHSGELVLGSLSFEMPAGPGGDIDVHLLGDLITWFPKGTSDDEPLASSTMCNLEIKEGKEAKAEVSRLKEEMENIKKILPPTDLFALGKVEAYEKLLIGRNITISK